MKKSMTPSLEDYLEAVFHLSSVNAQVRVTDIAQMLGIAKSSVNKAMGSLQELGHIVHERYGRVELTPAGEKIARHVIEKHSALMNFLMGVLGVEREVAEEEACKIEHVICDSTLQKIIEYTRTHMEEGLNKGSSDR